VRLEFLPQTAHATNTPHQEDAPSVTTDIPTNEATLPESADDGVATAGTYMLTATVLFILGLLVASVAAFQLVLPELASGIQYTTYGRLLPAGRILLINGWLPIAALGLTCFVIPQITREGLRRSVLATVALVLVALGALASAGGVIGGVSSGIPGQEGPLWARAISAIGFLMAAVVVTGTARRKRDHLGPAGWYLTAATWWLAASSVFGLVPLVDGTAGSIQAGFASVGLNQLFAMGIAVGLLYFAVGRLSGTDLTDTRPLAALGFWSLTLTWAFMGGAELIYSAVPNWYETLTVAFAIASLVPMLVIATDLGLILKGRVQDIGDRATLRYGVISALALATATIANLLGVWRATNTVVGYTTWTSGLELVIVLGGASFAIFAANSVRTGGRAGGPNLHFSLSVIGLVGIGASLLAGGLVTGFSWIAGPASQLFPNYGPGYEVAVVSLAPFLWVAAISLFVFLAGQIAYLMRVNATSDIELATPAQHPEYDLVFVGAARYATWKRLAWGAGVLWISAALFTAVIPMMDETDTAATITADRFRTYNAGSTELAGRNVYISEGCSECHTQSVRPVVTDVGLGPVSVAGDYAYENPALITGTRIGPDLMHAASRGDSFDAGLIAARLADPRATVDWSIMPSYSYLSDADISAITAYIETLR
jgi:cytochrome c oxidase cbb3-type subunit I/II